MAALEGAGLGDLLAVQGRRGLCMGEVLGRASSTGAPSRPPRRAGEGARESGHDAARAPAACQCPIRSELTN